jgi:outer membrane protein TolC
MNLLRGTTRKIVMAGVLFLPACSSIDPERAACFSPPLGMSSSVVNDKPPTTDGSIRSAGEEAETGQAKSPLELPPVPAAGTQGKPLPIDLPTALSLTNANPLDIQIAGERLRTASAQLERANVLWLPNVNTGVDYFRHDGRIQDVIGFVFPTSKSSLFLGAGPQAVFAVSDALFAPIAARQIVRARQAEVQAVRNDTTFQVAEAYFTVQQARGEVAGSIEALRRAEELVELTKKVTPDFAPTVEVNRAKAEAARRRQAVEAAYERWQVASAELTRILRLEPGTLLEPNEAPELTVELIDPAAPPDELIQIALTHRPELAADQAIIQAALARVRQEKVRPYLPTVAVRGVGSQVPGLAGGYFGGGINDFMGNFGGRFSIDIQAVWEIQNLGFGNRAARRERVAESQQALLQLLHTQDLVTAEVVQANARAKRATNRLKAAEDGLTNAVESAEKNLKGLVPGRRGPGGELALVIRPQEAVAAVTALDQAYRDYIAAVADHNRAQFQLYRALGHPAQCLINAVGPPAGSPAEPPTSPEEPVPVPPIPTVPTPEPTAGPTLPLMSTPRMSGS